MQLSGELSKVSLANLIQLVRNGALSGKIAFWQGTKTANIYVDRGAIIHVEVDTIEGREALMELFLWANGSFSFSEEPLRLIKRTINPFLPDDSTDRLLREGLAFVEQKKYLDQLRISGQTVLKPTELARYTPAALFAVVEPILQNIDGRKTIAEALATVPITRLDYVRAVSALLMEGLAVVVEAPIKAEEEQIQLPDWVLARLKQDNADISQAVIDMVIWVDRVKCWMFQADSDFARIMSKLVNNADGSDFDEDFFKDIGQDASDFQGPLFGESMPAALPELDIHSQSSGNNGGIASPRLPTIRDASIAPPKPPSIEF